MAHFMGEVTEFQRGCSLCSRPMHWGSSSSTTVHLPLVFPLMHARFHSCAGGPWAGFLILFLPRVLVLFLTPFCSLARKEDKILDHYPHFSETDENLPCYPGRHRTTEKLWPTFPFPTQSTSGWTGWVASWLSGFVASRALLLSFLGGSDESLLFG